VSPGEIAGRIGAGLIVGMLVGLTGVGGGILLLPILTSLLGIPPIVAVGSDAVVNCVTKMGAGFIHWRRGNVNWRLVFGLAMGSLPGAVLGVTFLNLLHVNRGSGVNEVLKMVIAVLLIVIPVISLLASRSAGPRPLFERTGISRDRWGIALIGLCVGIVVGITSIGSGTVTLMLLLVFYGFAPATLVGTDVVHGLLLTGVTGLLQMKLGNVDYPLVGYILVGSIPGGLIGAYTSNRVSSKRLKQFLYFVLITFGVRMLWEGLSHAQ
jgi:uncharacterized protein